MTHKYSRDESSHTAHLYVPSSFAWTALYEYVIDYQTFPPKLMSQRRTDLVNTSFASKAIGPNGMKVSRTGKLYMWEKIDDETGRFYGIDPFDGIVQIQVDVPIQPGSGGDNLEAEGLDIINVDETGFSRDSLPEVLVQTLDNSRDTWAGQHYRPDDPARL